MLLVFKTKTFIDDLIVSYEFRDVTWEILKAYYDHNSKVEHTAMLQMLELFAKDFTLKKTFSILNQNGIQI